MKGENPEIIDFSFPIESYNQRYLNNIDIDLEADLSEENFRQGLLD
jgi:hypothetical protein